MPIKKKQLQLITAQKVVNDLHTHTFPLTNHQCIQTKDQLKRKAAGLVVSPKLDTPTALSPILPSTGRCWLMLTCCLAHTWTATISSFKHPKSLTQTCLPLALILLDVTSCLKGLLPPHHCQVLLIMDWWFIGVLFL